MKRNMDLIRQILLAIEGEPSTQHEFKMAGINDLELWYNVDLLVQANLIRGVEVRWAADGAGPYAHSKGLVALTWDGHEFLEAIRNESVWRKANQKANASGLDLQSLTIEVIKSLCVSTAKQILGV